MHKLAVKYSWMFIGREPGRAECFNWEWSIGYVCFSRRWKNCKEIFRKAKL